MNEPEATLEELQADTRDMLHEYIRAAHRYFTRRMSATVAVDDAVSSTMFLVWQHMQAGRSVKLPHVYAIARGVLANTRRAEQRRRRLSEKAGVELMTQSVEPSDDGSILDTLREVLTEQELELLLLVAWEGLSLIDVSTILHIRPTAARKRFSRAREKARVGLQRDLPALWRSDADVSEAAPSGRGRPQP